MAVSVFKTWIAGEVLSAADLNSSFTQITDNGEDLGWPATKTKDFDGQKLDLDADADTSITADTDDQVDIEIGGTDLIKWVDGIYTYSDADAGTAIGPILKLFRNSASAADADFISALYFDGNDDAGTPAINTYASIECQIDDSGAGSEDGTLLVKTAVAGTATTQLDISSALVTVTPGITITSGDLTLSEGKIAITDTATETAFSVTSSSTTTDVATITANSLTSAGALRVISDSSNTGSSRDIVEIVQEHADPTDATALRVRQDGPSFGVFIDQNGNDIALNIDSESTSNAPIVTASVAVSTNFERHLKIGALTIYISDGTTAEGALTGVEGDFCLNGGTGQGQPAYCDDSGTNWTDV